jgi:hypothetical protein
MQSPSGGAGLAVPVTVMPTTGQAASDVIIIEIAQPAPADEINAGAAFGRDAGVLITQSLIREHQVGDRQDTLYGGPNGHSRQRKHPRHLSGIHRLSGHVPL